jgi:hypothetical protein
VWLSSEPGIVALIDGRNLPPPSTWALPEGAALIGPAVTVSVVGALSPAMVARAVAAVREVDAQMRWWGSASVWSTWIGTDQADAASRALHAAFLEN